MISQGRSYIMASKLVNMAASATAPGVLGIDEEELPSSHRCLSLPTDPETLKQASLESIGDLLGLDEHEAKDLLEHNAIQAAFREYSDTFLSSHPRASLSRPQGIQALFSFGKFFDHPEDFFEALAVDYHDHADFRGAEFVYWATQFLLSDECEARWNGIADIASWKLKDQCGLGIAMLYVLHREWQANHQQSLRR